MEKSRLSFIDYGKALGILFVLMIHAGTTFYEITGNGLPWICALYCVFAGCSGFIFRKKKQL